MAMPDGRDDRAPDPAASCAPSPLSSPLLDVVRHQADDGYWEFVYVQPAPSLRMLVESYCGYDERTVGPLRRREFPSGRVVLIIDFGPTLRLIAPTAPHAVTHHATGFVAGLHERFAVTETAGAQCGIEVRLTPLGACRVLGLSMNDLTHRVVGLGDVLGPAGADLAERLAHLGSWSDRFRALDRVLAARAAQSRPVSKGLTRAWQRLEASGGRVSVGTLAAELGCSRRHLIAQFRDQIGLPPKRLARIIRFERAFRQLTCRPEQGLAAIAHDCGYADQAHLNRDFRQFTGGPPTELLRRQLPDGGGTRGD